MKSTPIQNPNPHARSLYTYRVGVNVAKNGMNIIHLPCQGVSKHVHCKWTITYLQPHENLAIHLSVSLSVLRGSPLKQELMK